MCDHRHPHHPHFFTEALTYKDFIGEIEPNAVAGNRLSKLPYRDWAPLIPKVEYQGFKGDTFKFIVPNKYNAWCCYVKFDEFYEQVSDDSINASEAGRLLLWAGNIRFYCNCPAFTFYGMNYILTQLDAAIVPEERFPKKMNPELKGVVCKHGIKTMKVLPFHTGHFASAVKAARAGIETSFTDDDLD